MGRGRGDGNSVPRAPVNSSFSRISYNFISLYFISESLRFDQFCERIRQLFGSDIKNTDLKAIYRKISTNPDAKVDWSEVSIIRKTY